MKYKVRKYKKRLKHRPYKLETYEPKRRIEVRKENTVPLLIKIGNKFVFLGGVISFVASSFLMAIKGYFHIEKEIKKISRKKGRVVEIKCGE